METAGKTAWSGCWSRQAKANEALGMLCTAVQRPHIDLVAKNGEPCSPWPTEAHLRNAARPEALGAGFVSEFCCVRLASV